MLRGIVGSRFVTGLLGVGVGAALIAGGIAYASAGAGTTYTGCLSISGSVYNVRAGSSPLAACTGGDATLKLSGGDITAISAGAGLQGGAARGGASLSIAPGYALPQGCATGDVPAFTPKAWICSHPTAIVRSVIVNTPLPTGTSTQVDSFTPPPGSYTISARIHLTAPSTFDSGVCALQVSAGALIDQDGETVPTPITLYGAATFAAGDTLTTSCGAGNTGMGVYDIQLVMTPVGAITSE